MTTAASPAPVAIHKDWLDHPLVRRAASKADGELVAMLEQLHADMAELERRFPGVPFHKILEAPTGEIAFHDDVQAMQAEAASLAQTRHAHIMDLHDAGMSQRQIAKALDLNPSLVNRYIHGKVPTITPHTGVWQRIGRHAHENGYRVTIDEFGRSKSYVLQCRDRYRKAIGWSAE